jgi:Transposase and inactivated derivatives
VEDDGPTVKAAPMPPQLLPQGIVSPELLAYILVNKFADGLPFYRQSVMFDRLGVDISRATMSGWALRAVEACEPLLELLHKQIQSGPTVNLDETTRGGSGCSDSSAAEVMTPGKAGGLSL